MSQFNTDVIQGTLDMLILKTLSPAPLHGYGIGNRIEQISDNVFKVNPGSLLTALRRLERSGLLDSKWRETENSRKAKYYSLTRAGTDGELTFLEGHGPLPSPGRTPRTRRRIGLQMLCPRQPTQTRPTAVPWIGGLVGSLIVGGIATLVIRRRLAEVGIC